MRQLLFYMNKYKNKQYSCQNQSICNVHTCQISLIFFIYLCYHLLRSQHDYIFLMYWQLR